jgi:hypothetical protein
LAKRIVDIAMGGGGEREQSQSNVLMLAIPEGDEVGASKKKRHVEIMAEKPPTQ